ncbi:hypothetical protein [Rhizobium oryzicola]|uniref:Uncharacterized protein n=1 Tax=Rhizobium oryzicola TaxID=1232668 RepID=A0ABT8SQA2_9HYPH|nr:hypothetical protein [Rhizobium oryzicola]MDO1580662.1 hypothetical protein [Rhizobium oryzicola]
MKRGMSLLLAVAMGFGLATSAIAADKRSSPDWLNPAPAYKDLPGVVPEAERLAKEQANEPKCTTDIEYQRWRGSDVFDSGFPVRVYRCEQNGVTFTGTELPNKPWVPGLNPSALPK